MLGIQNPQFHTFFEQPYTSDLNLGFNLPWRVHDEAIQANFHQNLSNP